MLGCELAACVLGHEVRHLADEAIAHGAQTVYLIDDPVLAQYRTEAYLHGMLGLIEKYRPEALLLGATTLGRDLAGRVRCVAHACDDPSGLAALGTTSAGTPVSISRAVLVLPVPRGPAKR